MRTRDPIALATILTGLLMFSLAGMVFAEEGKDESLFPGLHSQLQFTGVGYGGPNGTAKYQEYRDLPQGGQADFIGLQFENEKQTYDFDLSVKNAGLEDMDLVFKGEEYGKWKMTFEFNRIPHRFQNDVGTLFSGAGTTELRIPDALQAAVQATASDPAMVSLLRSSLHDSPSVERIGLQRDQFDVNFAFIQLDPVTMGIDLSHEERQGTRPIGSGFGFSNALGLIEPIDYGTTDAMFWVAFDKAELHLKAFYGFNYFENRKGSLSFDNPFRNTDGITAALTPAAPTNFLANAYTSNRTQGSREGKQSLPSDNLEHRMGFEFGYDAPAETRVTAGFTLTWRKDDPRLHAYTVNTALVGGLPYNPDGSTDIFNPNPPFDPPPFPDGDEYTIPFNAFDKANLPQQDFNGLIETQRFNLGLTNTAIHNLEIRARYRYYNLDNQNDQIDFPGYVRADVVWENEEITNEIHQYSRHEGGIDFTYAFTDDTRATIGYKFVDMLRETRDVDSVWDHTLVASVDSNPVKWLESRIGYEHTWRRNDGYLDMELRDREETGEAIVPGSEPAVLPFLRRFDESEYDRDKLNAQFTFPTEIVTPTCGYSLLATDYDASFGLMSDIAHGVNAGVDSDPCPWMHVGVSGNLEWRDASQRSRQWSPLTTLPVAQIGTAGSGVGDPYFTDTGEFSFSNWQSNIFDRTLTLNSSMIFDLIADKLAFETFYTYRHSGENVGFDSPMGRTNVGTNVAQVAPVSQYDNNPRDESLFEFSNADNSTWHNARAQFRWHVRKNLTVVFGYLWEKFDHEDYRNQGYSAVSTNPAGGYNGYLGLNVDPQDYESHAGFISVLWDF